MSTATYYRVNLDIKPVRKLLLLQLRAMHPLGLPFPVLLHMPITALARWITTTLVTLIPIRMRNVLCLAHLHYAFAWTFTYPAQSTARQPVQSVADFGAPLRGLLTLVEASQYHVDGEAPEEGAASGEAGDEERGDEEEERYADGEEGVGECGGDGEQETCREGDEESRGCEEDEEDEGYGCQGCLSGYECL